MDLAITGFIIYNFVGGGMLFGIEINNTQIDPELLLEDTELETNSEMQSIDAVHIANLVSTSERTKDGKLQFEGLITIFNDQQIGVAGVIVTLQLVDNGKPEITQVVTDDNGDGEFDFSIEPGNWRIEILDVTGENFVYDKTLNSVQGLKGRAGL